MIEIGIEGRKIRARPWHYANNEQEFCCRFLGNGSRKSNRPLPAPTKMKFLAVHPSCLMYSKIYLRLEPLGLELVAAAAEHAGHSVQLIDLQCESHRDFFRAVKVEPGALYIHNSGGRSGRQIDHHTEEFVNATRMGAAS